jgi:hypothetical protein
MDTLRRYVVRCRRHRVASGTNERWCISPTYPYTDPEGKIYEIDPTCLDNRYTRYQLGSQCIDRERESKSGPPDTAPLQVLYTVVRGDLPHGTQVAQTAHAASEASGYPTTIAVALMVPDEDTLRRVADALGEHSLTYRLIVEDAGPYAGQAMALGIKPTTDRAAISRVTSALPLVK